LINADGSPGFNVDCGIRLHASGPARNGITPDTKNSMRLYFREVYGARTLDYPLIPASEATSFKKLVLRAGKNDPNNPFIRDEMIRRTHHQMGHVAALGSFANVFLNGVFQRHYNPTERLDDNFMRSKHGGDNDWDVIRPSSDVAEGDGDAWFDLLDFTANNDLSIPANYNIIEASLDLVNFVDYLILNIYGANFDWPSRNWVAAKEKIPGAKFRFYIWDAEGVFGMWDPVTFNTIEEDLKTNSDEIASLYRALVVNPTFRSLWAGRVRDNFYGDGALTDASLRKRWLEMRADLSEVLSTMTGQFPLPWGATRPPLMYSFMFDENLMEPLNVPGPRAIPMLAINEFMASNSTIADGSGEFDDWIEIYNPTENPIDMAGLYLTDDLSNTTKWPFPAATTIPAFGFLVVWADEDSVTQGGLHTNFRLRAAGEEIGIFDTLANGNVAIEVVRYGVQTTDVSSGRRPDGIGGIVALPGASPGASNGTIPPISSPAESWVRSDLQVGADVKNVAIGDVNRDGNLDLVSTNFNFGRVAVFLNDGPGLRTFQGPAIYAVSLGAKGLALGDLNDDDYLDIVTVNDSLVDYTISTLPNNQDGTFGAPTHYPLYSIDDASKEILHPQSVVAADINGDGWVDVVVSNQSPQVFENSLGIFLNDGTGGLLPVSQLDIHRFSLSAFGQNLLAEDLNGDLDVDLVATTDFRPLSVSINLGGGTFAPAVGTPGGITRSASIMAADLDNDGDVDLAGVDGKSSFFHVYLNEGDGTFANAAWFETPSGGSPAVITAGDWDRDGDNDIAVAAHGENPGVTIFLNDGSGVFSLGESEVELPPSADNIAYPEAIVSGDLDSSGTPDLVVADGISGNLVVFFNQIQRTTSRVLGWESYD
jgi:CotH protein/lamin tail-like protein/VCBS repeat protein